VRHGLKLPRRQTTGLYAGEVLWKDPSSSALYSIVKNPAYAGAFAYGRRTADPTRQVPGQPCSGRCRRRAEQWIALVKDVYPAYITWDEFEQIQRSLEANQQKMQEQFVRMRRDGFGGYIDSRETRLIEAQWKIHPLVAENGAAYADYLAGKVAGWTMERVMDEMLAHHVNYLPMGWGLQDWQALHAQRPDLVKKASLQIGYRLVVTEASWPPLARPGESLEVRTVWRNTAAGRLPFPWHPAVYLLVPDSGRQVARVVHRETDPRTWVAGHDEALRFPLAVPAEIRPGRYAVAVGIEDNRGEPVVALGIEGGDAKHRFLLGHLEVGK
jgi:hypothetical protein